MMGMIFYFILFYLFYDIQGMIISVQILWGPHP